MLLRPDESCLLVIDMQARLVPATAGHAVAVGNCRRLLQAAARLDVPVLAAELNPAGLGATVPGLRRLIPGDAVFEKTHFSCVADADWRARIDALGREIVVVAGMEAHVCVLQTVLELAESGRRPALVADAVASRSEGDRTAALERCRANGVEVVTTEMVIFEWLRRPDGAAFRDLLPLIKAGPEGVVGG